MTPVLAMKPQLPTTAKIQTRRPQKRSGDPVYVGGASANSQRATEEASPRTDEPHTLQGSTRLLAIADNKAGITKRCVQN